MPIYIYILLISLICSNQSISTLDLIKFQNKYYLANSYEVYSGEVVDYYNNGIKKYKGYFTNGFKDGKWFEFYNTGIIKSETTYNNNNSTSTSFHDNSKIKSFGMLINDNKNGLWIDYDYEGNEISHSFYSNGILDSVNNMKISVENKLDEENNNSEKIDTVKTEIIKIRHGKYTTYYNSGEFLIENYNQGILDGLSTLYHKNEKKHVERIYSNGNPVNRTYEYDNLGLLVKSYQEKLDNQGNLLKNGKYISYYTNGNIYEAGYLEDGYRKGQWSDYDIDGNKQRDLFYTSDSLSIDSTYIRTSIITYYETGEKYSEHIANSFLDCKSDSLCDIYSGYQHNFEIREGNFNSYYRNGILKEQGIYENNIKEDQWYEFYPNNNILSSIHYVRGNGLYTSYYDDSTSSKIHIIGYYINENKNGLWKEYDNDGELIRDYYYKENMLDVNYPMQIYYKSNEIKGDIEYNPDSIQLKAKFFCRGTPENYMYDGVFESFYSNNNPETTGVHKNNNKYGFWKEYYSDKSLKSEVNFDEFGNGNYTSYLITGEIISSGNYKDYLKDGKWIIYYDNGNIEWILFYLNDKINPNKLCSNWYDSGYKKIESFLVQYTGKIIWDGKYIEYYENGIIYIHGYYSYGVKTNKWVEYYPNRMIKSQGNYINDNQVGQWDYYNEDGEIIKAKLYE